MLTWLSWPLFGRTRTLNAAAQCASLSSVSAGQQRNEQVADACDTVDGSDGGCHQVQQRGTATHARYGHPGQESTHALGCTFDCEQVRAGSYGSGGGCRTVAVRYQQPVLTTAARASIVAQAALRRLIARKTAPTEFVRVVSGLYRGDMPVLASRRDDLAEVLPVIKVAGHRAIREASVSEHGRVYTAGNFRLVFYSTKEFTPVVITLKPQLLGSLLVHLTELSSRSSP